MIKTKKYTISKDEYGDGYIVEAEDGFYFDSDDSCVVFCETMKEAREVGKTAVPLDEEHMWLVE